MKRGLDVLLGNSETGREKLVLEASGRTALRKGDWLMIPPYNGPKIAAQVNIELGNSDGFQLYNLNADIAQQTNLAGDNPQKLEEMVKEYESTVGLVKSDIEQLELK